MRREDQRLLRGDSCYLADIQPWGAHAVFVRSTVAAAHIASIDVSAARAAPGVVAVLTGHDLGLAPAAPDLPALNQSMTRAWLATEVVRFVGEPIALVVAESLALAHDAAELVEVAYELGSPVVGIRSAVGGSVLVHPAAGTNECLRFEPTGAVDGAGSVEVVVELDQPKVSPAPLEGRGARASWDGSVLTLCASTQGVHPYRGAVAKALGVDPSAVVVRSLDVGGSFGGKGQAHIEEIIVARAAQLCGRTVQWVDERSESIATLGHSRGQQQHLVLRGDDDGTIRSLDYTVVQDSGAYPRLGAFMSNMSRLMLPGPYRIPSVRVDATSVVTNTNPHVAYRGAGQPEYALAVEGAIDRFARRVGLDPLELRRRNLVTATEFPYTSATGMVYDSGDYPAALARLAEVSGYEALRREQAARRSSGQPLGIGVATFCESCSTSNQPEWGRVTVNADGTVDAYLGTSPHGQGHETVFAGLICAELGDGLVIRMHHGDSTQFESGTVTGGSRSAQTGGLAITKSVQAARAAGARVAAQLLEAAEADIVYDRATLSFSVAGTPARRVGLFEAAAGGEGGCLDAALKFEPSGGTISFGAYLAVVEVDTETGKVELLRFVAVDDAGRVLNHQIVEGQVHGGVVQGIGQALYEEIVYDADGTLRTSNFTDYLIPSAADVPPIEAYLVETPSPRNELGVKGIGESGPIGALPVVINAVVDALAHLGVEQVPIPASPENVWRAINPQ